MVVGEKKRKMTERKLAGEQLIEILMEIDQNQLSFRGLRPINMTQKNVSAVAPSCFCENPN